MKKAISFPLTDLVNEEVVKNENVVRKTPRPNKIHPGDKKSKSDSSELQRSKSEISCKTETNIVEIEVT